MTQKKKSADRVAGAPSIENRRARHDYHILDRVEAGMVLTGSEVKSLRGGKGNLQDAYAILRDGEMWLLGAHISLYDQAGAYGHDDPTRTRKLLLHREEIVRLAGEISKAGLTVVPLRLYFKNGRAKIELGVCKGKKLHDKRDDLKKKDQKREMQHYAKGGRVKI